MHPIPLRDAIARFRAILDEHGLYEAMRFANRLSEHRFTAVYRFEDATLRNVLFVDRDDASVRLGTDLPVLDSYCVFVRQARDSFLTDASLRDPRVAGHPKQRSVQSYCGIPLFAEDGTLFGTVCHFDYAPRAFGEDEVAMLEAVAPLVIRAIEQDGPRRALDAAPGLEGAADFGRSAA